MSELVITLLRLNCEEVTDDFLEGLTDEIGWKVTASDPATGQTLSREEIPMPELTAVASGSKHEIDRALCTLGPEWRDVRLEFWDKDTFSADDLLGAIEISRDGQGALTVSAGTTAQDLGDGAFRLTGEDGDYKVWLRIEEV